MLYISRYIGKDAYGVVDTNTWDEEIMSFDRILEVAFERSIKIRGVDTVVFGQSGGRVCAYQPDELQTPLKLKAKMMTSVVVKTFASVITAVDWNICDIKHDVSIRLSDFGTSCADYLLDNVGKSSRDLRLDGGKKPNSGMVTLILDGKLQFAPLTFALFGYDFSVINRLNVKFDMRELPETVAYEVYDMLFLDCPTQHFDNIIDDDERSLRMQRHYTELALKRLEDTVSKLRSEVGAIHQ